jgi:uncharacterized C2H2 Zn-finger protein
MAKITLKCPKCGKSFSVEMSPYAIDPHKRETFQPLRCPACGAWEKMKKK